VDENQQYGYIIDKSSVNNKNVSVCHARSNRQTHLYLSTSNTLQLVLANDDRANFLLRVQGLNTFYADVPFRTRKYNLKLLYFDGAFLQ